MTCSQGLGAVQQNCAPACDNMPPVRDWYLADKIAESVLVPGGTANVRLTGLQAFDSLKRVAMVTGIRLVGSIGLNVAGAVPVQVDAYNMLAQWGSIFLEDAAGWQYLAGVDGRDLWDDRYMRTSVVAGFDPLPAGFADPLDPGDHEIRADLYFPLARPGVIGPAGILDSIPLAALQARGDSAFRFTSPAALAVPVADVTFQGFKGLTEIWLEIAYISDPVIDRPWQLETYETADTSGQLRHADRTHEYAAVRHFSSDNGGMYIDDYGGITFQVNGQTIVSAYTLAQWNQRTFYKLANQGGTGLLAQDSEPILFSNGASRIGLIVGPASHARAGMAAGRVQFNFAERVRSKTRFLHRTIACQTVNHVTKIASTVQCKASDQCIGLDNGGVCAPSSQTALIVTNRLVR